MLELINTVTHMKEGTYVFVFTILLGIKLQLAVNKYHYTYSLTEHFYPLKMRTQMRAQGKNCENTTYVLRHTCSSLTQNAPVHVATAVDILAAGPSLCEHEMQRPKRVSHTIIKRQVIP